MSLRGAESTYATVPEKSTAQHARVTQGDITIGGTIQDGLFHGALPGRKGEELVTSASQAELVECLEPPNVLGKGTITINIKDGEGNVIDQQVIASEPGVVLP